MPIVTAAAPHQPVLLDRVVELLSAAPDGLLVDGTVGAAGHARALLDARIARYGHARLLGIDRDPSALELATETLADHLDDPAVEVVLRRARFDAMPALLDELGEPPVAGVFLDLGISSMHVDEARRGFSYRNEGPLDMRMDPDLPRSAGDLVNDLPEGELAQLLQRYADERFARRIARAIVAARPLATTTQLAEVVRDAVPAAARRHGGHPATRTFQALRIAVNDELGALDAVLPVIIDRLAPGGVAVVLSYHSLEDRRVKRAFADAARGCICPPDLPVCGCGRTPAAEPIVRRPERPSDAEIATNPRASAARLRALRRLPTSEVHP